MCGRPGRAERHHGVSRGAGGDSTEENRFDLCPVCHGKAQRYEPGFLLADLERARGRVQKWMEIEKDLFG